MDFNIFLLLVVCTILCTQSNYQMAYAMIGTDIRNAQYAEFPFLAGFRQINLINPHPTRYHICTGAFVTRSHVLSAAQCIQNREKNQTVVTHGSNILDYCLEKSILWWLNFHSWNNYMNNNLEFRDNDVGITKISTPIQGSFTPALLSGTSAFYTVGQYIALVAWGVNNQRRLSRNLLASTAKILMNSDCEERLEQASGRRIPIADNLFCTHQTPFTLLRRGDFGGPVLYFNKIIGINKEVLPDLVHEYNKDKVNIHTSIHYYRSFITHVTDIDFEWI